MYPHTPKCIMGLIMAISHCHCHLIGQEMAISHFWILRVSTGQEWLISHCYWHLVVNPKWQFHHCYCISVQNLVKNGNFTLLLTSSDQEWQFHIGYWHIVVKNSNFTLLLTSGQDLADESTLANEPPSHLSIEYRCLEYCYTKLGRWTNFGWWTPQIEHRCLEFHIGTDI